MPNISLHICIQNLEDTVPKGYHSVSGWQNNKLDLPICEKSTTRRTKQLFNNLWNQVAISVQVPKYILGDSEKYRG